MRKSVVPKIGKKNQKGHVKKLGKVRRQKKNVQRYLPPKERVLGGDRKLSFREVKARGTEGGRGGKCHPVQEKVCLIILYLKSRRPKFDVSLKLR